MASMVSPWECLQCARVVDLAADDNCPVCGVELPELLVRTACIPATVVKPAYPIDPVTGIDAKGNKWVRSRRVNL